MSARLSPVDGAPMRKVRRYGVEMDICTRTGGVWLDPGELERVIAYVQGEVTSRRVRDEDVAEYGYSEDDGGARRRRQYDLHMRSRLSDDFDF